MLLFFTFRVFNYLLIYLKRFCSNIFDLIWTPYDPSCELDCLSSLQAHRVGVGHDDHRCKHQEGSWHRRKYGRPRRSRRQRSGQTPGIAVGHKAFVVYIIPVKYGSVYSLLADYIIARAMDGLSLKAIGVTSCLDIAAFSKLVRNEERNKGLRMIISKDICKRVSHFNDTSSVSRNEACKHVRKSRVNSSVLKTMSMCIAQTAGPSGQEQIYYED